MFRSKIDCVRSKTDCDESGPTGTQFPGFSPLNGEILESYAGGVLAWGGEPVETCATESQCATERPKLFSQICASNWFPLSIAPLPSPTPSLIASHREPFIRYFITSRCRILHFFSLSPSEAYFICYFMISR